MLCTNIKRNITCVVQISKIAFAYCFLLMNLISNKYCIELFRPKTASVVNCIIQTSLYVVPNFNGSMTVS